MTPLCESFTAHGAMKVPGKLVTLPSHDHSPTTHGAAGSAKIYSAGYHSAAPEAEFIPAVTLSSAKQLTKPLLFA